MLAVSWIYTIHNLIITYLTLGILRQLFYIKRNKIQTISYVLWMQAVFIFNDFFIQAHLPLEFKYLSLFVGFTFGFIVFLKLPIVSTTLFMIVNLAINGIATNFNIVALLLTQFDSYGLALESDFIQYTSLVMVTLMVFMILKTFDVRILDISRYN
ncbi:MAG: hypothetical protein JEZ08_15455 [Clostridiales bacterium]|nr:hypothetical protein [Clostridiales bacterium]